MPRYFFFLLFSFKFYRDRWICAWLGISTIVIKLKITRFYANFVLDLCIKTPFVFWRFYCFACVSEVIELFFVGGGLASVIDFPKLLRSKLFEYKFDNDMFNTTDYGNGFASYQYKLNLTLAISFVFRILEASHQIIWAKFTQHFNFCFRLCTFDFITRLCTFTDRHQNQSSYTEFHWIAHFQQRYVHQDKT